MPTQENLGELLSGNETKDAKPSDTLAQKVRASAKPNLTDTSNGMDKGQALAVAWTGIEALAQMKQARIYRSSKEADVVWVKFIQTEYDANTGLEPL